MTNREKYKDFLIDLVLDGRSLAIVHGKPTGCDKARCVNCDLYEACAESLQDDAKELKAAVRRWADAQTEEN